MNFSNSENESPPLELLYQLLGLYRNGKLKDAEELSLEITQKFPKHQLAWKVLGGLLAATGRISEAIDANQTAVALSPQDAEAHNNLGVSLQNLGKLKEAELSFIQAIALKPDYAEAYSNFGFMLKEVGRFHEAVANCNQAIALKPGLAGAHNNLGIALQELLKFDEAEKSYRQAIAFKPEYVEAHSNLGSLLQEQGKLDKAEESYNQALSLKPDYANALDNLGSLHHEWGNFSKAESSYKQAIALTTDNARIYLNLSITYLLRGRFDKGLQLYEYRLQDKSNTTPIPKPNLTWDGSGKVDGKKFLVYEEQGLGDIIQFSRYLTMLEAKGAIVTFKVTAKLHALLKTMRNSVNLSEVHLNESDIDFEAPLMSLPLLFDTHKESIPVQSSYLLADPGKIANFASKLRGKSFKVGICWQGGLSKVDKGRSFPLSLFKSISELSDIELISLQKGEGENQISEVTFDIKSFGADLDQGQDAFLDTAALIVNCDLIITSDTAVAHLAGALGCPTWVALKRIPDWRWMLETTSTPWYPSMKLYRQRKAGDWDSVFHRIKKDLSNLIENKLASEGVNPNAKSVY